MKNDRWVFYKDAVAEDNGQGVVRRVLAYSDDLMVVENTFAKYRDRRRYALQDQWC